MNNDRNQLLDSGMFRKNSPIFGNMLKATYQDRGAYQGEYGISIKYNRKQFFKKEKLNEETNLTKKKIKTKKKFG